MSRRPALLALAALAVAAPQADAHNAAAVPTCTAADITGALFAPGANRVQVTVTTATGEVVTTSVDLVNGQTVRVPYVLSPGAHRVSVLLSWDLPDHTQRPYLAGRADVVCTAPAADPVPAPVPPVPEVTPGPVAPPPVVAIPTPTPTPPRTAQDRARLVPATSYRVVRAVACKRIGGRAYSIVRIRVTWKRDGVVVKTKTATIRRAGGPCRAPAVTG